MGNISFRIKVTFFPFFPQLPDTHTRQEKTSERYHFLSCIQVISSSISIGMNWIKLCLIFQNCCNIWMFVLWQRGSIYTTLVKSSINRSLMSCMWDCFSSSIIHVFWLWAITITAMRMIWKDLRFFVSVFSLFFYQYRLCLIVCSYVQPSCLSYWSIYFC